MTTRTPHPSIDTERIKNAVREILLAIGEDPQREGLLRTPERVAAMYKEIFSDIGRDPADILAVGFEEDHQEMVILRNIPFYSMCEHHLLPFHGRAHVGYIPSGRVVGISKIARVVETYARRPQLQERLTSQIADAIMEHVKPWGVGIVIEAEHLCMTMRGIRKPGSVVVTSASRGIFRTRTETRAEFMSLIGHSERG
ncbi:MAG TPA: GTP cyclohydrolase I FolE [Chloroflexi bacterium]|jgi:GTP cyclohydrolase I|nr:GTP cyclohydrolase I FolE [Chloroflexota bacterium]